VIGLDTNVLVRYITHDDRRPAETIWKAVRLFEGSKADFADCLIERTGAAHECEYTSTFDNHAASTGMRLIE